MAPDGVVGIDAGQSGCRLAQVVDGTLIAAGKGPGFHYETGQDPTAGVLSVVRSAWEDAAAPSLVPHTVCLGITGPCGTGEGIERLAAGIREFMGPVPVVRVAGDHVTSYAGALGLKPGLVLAAGTGVIALAVNGAGKLRRAAGWGYLLGDEGGGFWIGRRGIEAALRAIDGRGPHTSLIGALRSSFGRTEELHRTVYLRPDMVAIIAGFSRSVAEEAGAGDVVAAQIWSDASQELAITCVAAARSAFGESEPFRLACIGGLLAAGPLLTQPLQHALARELPHASMVVPLGTSLDGAVRLAAAEDLGTLSRGVLDHHA